MADYPLDHLCELPKLTVGRRGSTVVCGVCTRPWRDVGAKHWQPGKLADADPAVSMVDTAEEYGADYRVSAEKVKAALEAARLATGR